MTTEYESIDDAAFPELDEGPWISVAHRKIRADLLATLETRLPGCGIAYVEAIRVCPIMPAAYGPYMLYLPPGEPWEQIVIRVRFDTIEFPTVANGTDAIYLFATCCTPNGWIEYPPAVDPDDSDSDGISDSGHVILEKGDSGTVDLTAEVRGQRGEVGVCLWVQAAIRDTAEDSGTVAARDGYDSVELNGYALALTNPPERAISLSYRAGENQPDRHYTQLCRILLSGGLDYAYTEPPVFYGGPSGRVTDWHIWEIGVMPLQAVTVVGVAPAARNVPHRHSFHTDERVAEQWLALTSKLEHLRRGRVPIWACCPGAAEDGTLLPLLSSSAAWGAGPAGLTANTWTVVDRCLLDNPTADSNGYAGLLGLYLLIDSHGAVLRSNTLSVRLAVYDAKDDMTAAPTAVETSDDDQITVLSRNTLEDGRLNSDLASWTAAANYHPIAHTMARTITSNGTWQLRGAMLFDMVWDREDGHDYGSLIWARAELDEPDSGDYPLILTLEVMPRRTDAAMAIGIQSTLLRSRRLLEST